MERKQQSVARGNSLRWSGGWALLLCLVAVGSASFAAADEPVACPPELLEAAATMRGTMQGEHDRIRQATREQPQGVEETVQFDLDAHACHRGPGQAYRVYAEPRCSTPDAQGQVAVRYPYQLFYRKALTLERLFAADWQSGTGGAEQVTFAREGQRWLPVARKDLLLLPEKDGPPASGHPSR